MSDLSLWDIYRSGVVLLALVAPRALADESASLLAMTRQGTMGMPRWPFANLYTEDMVGRHGVPMLTDCVVTTGACAGRVSLADAAAAATAAVSAQDALIPSYAAVGGYAAWPEYPGSLTAEYAIDDFAASILAAAAGDAAGAATFRARAGNWRSSFDAAVPTMPPRLANGTFVTDGSIYAPHPFNNHYTEGNAAQWMWAVPHDMPALVAAYPGGADEFAAVLGAVLANQTYWTSAFSTFLPNPFCWLGNEPSMLLPWSHAWAGPSHAAEAAYWPRWHLRTYYTPTEDMIPGCVGR
jgi:putative alpha-1,2-mannosidase